MEREPKCVKCISFVRHLNRRYVISYRGIINILEMISAIVIICLMISYCKWKNRFTELFSCNYADWFYMMVVFASFMLTILHFVCRVISENHSLLLEETIYEPLHYSLCAILYVASSIGTIVEDVRHTKEDVRKLVASDELILALCRRNLCVPVVLCTVSSIVSGINKAVKMFGFFNIFLYGLSLSLYFWNVASKLKNSRPRSDSF